MEVRMNELIKVDYTGERPDVYKRQVDCYCKDCTGACKWEWRGIEVAVMDKQTCETCTHFPPSACDGKPCSLCDSEDTKLDCYQRKEEQDG